MGLVILAALALYFLISIAVVVGAALFASHRGRSGWRWGVAAALVMYLIPFWDWLPTIAMHRYYCATEAGFWVYKSVDQWKAENPGVMETLVANKGYPSSHQGDMVNYVSTNFLNSQFNLVVKYGGPLFLHRWVREDTLIDTKTNETLARYVDFSTSYARRQAGWSGWKFWLDTRHCVGGIDKAIASGNWMGQFKGAEK